MLQKFKIHLYVYLASIEILLHMSAATLCVGLGCNFQLCLFGVILFFFIIECILPDKKKSITPVLILSSLYSVAIVALYVAGNRISPFYPLSLAETGTMAVVIVIFVLLLIITSMLFLLRYMVHEEEKLTKKAEYDALTGIPNRFYDGRDSETFYRKWTKGLLSCHDRYRQFQKHQRYLRTQHRG